jgi:hypothetical protein
VDAITESGLPAVQARNRVEPEPALPDPGSVIEVTDTIEVIVGPKPTAAFC